MRLVARQKKDPIPESGINLTKGMLCTDCVFKSNWIIVNPCEPLKSVRRGWPEGVFFESGNHDASLSDVLSQFDKL